MRLPLRRSTDKTSEVIKKLSEAALDVRKKAYCPYSGFAVGAALLAKSGEIYTGVNIENAAFTPTNCAERTAFFTAIAKGERDFVAVAIAGGKAGEEPEDFCAPCGVCRQVMRVLPSASFVGLYLLLFDRQKLRLRPRDIWCFAGSGICSLMLFSWCYFTGMQAASRAVMAVLLYTAPVFVMLMSSVFFREKLTGAKLTALVLCLAGCVLVFVPSVGLFYLSDIMGGGLVLVGNLIRDQLLKVRDWNVGSAMSMVHIALSAGIYLLYRKVGGDDLGVMCWRRQSGAESAKSFPPSI